MSTRHRNLPLIAGSMVVLLLLGLALFGPAIAPHDPLARQLIAIIGGRTRGAPFPPFQSWEFPLGSDRFGRDLYSRLLYAVRPTLILVTIVALVRLSLGLLIGTVAGWSQRLGARALSGLIDAALAIPVLVVALAAITAVGIETGLIAFIIGMSLSGWAETAQRVRAQTQLVATQPYIAAARALGATGPQIVLRHISRHIGPLLATLLAFEISATLMLTGALAFLGYFIGGGVWIITDGNLIPVAERVAGMPELGQLVGTAEIRVSSRPPWEIMFPGLVIVLAILGFTLLGEGLRRRQSLTRPDHAGLLTRLLGAPLGRVEEALLIRAGGWDGRAAGGVYGMASAVLLLGAGLIWWQNRPPDAPSADITAGAALETVGGWSAQRGDPYGTLRGTATAPAAPTVAWELNSDGELSAPAVGPDGTIYIADMGSGVLLALDHNGGRLWESALEGEPVGAPAVGPDGTIYVAGNDGGLSAYSPAGERNWHFTTSYRSQSTSGPIVGLDGNIYYAVLDAVQAVSPQGEGLWLGRNPDLPYQELLPRLSPDGELVFLKDTAFSTGDGSIRPLTVVPDEAVFAEGAFLVGADGRTYYRSEHRVVPWRKVEAGVAVQPPLAWGAGTAFYMPSDVGVTIGGTAWLLYSTDFADLRLIWVGADGDQRGEAFYPLRGARALAANDDDTLEICGLARSRRLECAAFGPASGEQPLWTVELGKPGSRLMGGAVAGDRLYIVATNGTLYALE